MIFFLQQLEFIIYQESIEITKSGYGIKAELSNQKQHISHTKHNTISIHNLLSSQYIKICQLLPNINFFILLKKLYMV